MVVLRGVHRVHYKHTHRERDNSSFGNNIHNLIIKVTTMSPNDLLSN